jgi:protein-S-isoprenylcysteine O-methyltransferase Ste14
MEEGMTRIEKTTIRERTRSEVRRTISEEDRQPEPAQLVAWLATLATLGTILVPQFLARGDSAYVRGVGVFVLALAAALIFSPFFLLRKHGQIEDGGTYMQTRIVVDQGLYAIIRHPQYLGYILLALGFAALSQHWLTALLAAVSTTLFYLQAAAEERTCLARLGEPYKQYLQRVPRFNLILGIVRRMRRPGTARS